MKLPNKSATQCSTSGLAAVIAASIITSPAHAKHPGYVEDRTDSVVHSGFGECVHTSAWQSDLRIPECGAQQAAVTPEPQTQQAAFETPRPMETLSLDAKTLFEFDKATLQPAARGKLDELAERMGSQAEVLFVNVTGHTDRIGTTEYNESLSKQRAAAVTDYLQNNTDLRSAKFQVVGAGESQPVVNCEGNSAKSTLIDCLEPNRRVEVEVSLVQPAQASSQ